MNKQRTIVEAAELTKEQLAFINNGRLGVMSHVEEGGSVSNREPKSLSMSPRPKTAEAPDDAPDHEASEPSEPAKTRRERPHREGRNRTLTSREKRSPLDDVLVSKSYRLRHGTVEALEHLFHTRKLSGEKNVKLQDFVQEAVDEWLKKNADLY